MLTQKQIDEEFNDACATGDLVKIKSMLFPAGLAMQANIHNNHETPLKNAVLGNFLPVVQYLLSAPEIAPLGYPDHRIGQDIIFITAATNGYEQLVHYLASSPDLHTPSDINAQEGRALINACMYGHINVVRYLLTSLELPIKANLKDGAALRVAVREGKLEVVKFLISHSELGSAAATIDASIIKTAINAGQEDILALLLSLLNTSELQAYLQVSFIKKKPLLRNLIHKLLLYKSLSQSLPIISGKKATKI